MKNGINIDDDQTRLHHPVQFAAVSRLQKQVKDLVVELFAWLRQYVPLGFLLAGAVLLAKPAHAGGCDSAAKITSGIWNKYDEVIKTVGTAAGPEAQAAVVAAEVSEKMIAFWNTMSKNNWATVGPRELTFGATHKGKLVSTGGRMFVSTHPLDVDTVVLKIKKTDGKAKTGVTVCKDKHGAKTKVWEFTIDNGKDNVGKTWSKTLGGMKGHLLTVSLDAESVANTMSYELLATKK